MKSALLLLILNAAFAAPTFGCWIDHLIAPSDLEHWPLPFRMEASRSDFSFLPNKDRGTITVRLVRRRDVLDLPTFGKVQEISVRLYKSALADSRDRMISGEFEWERKWPEDKDEITFTVSSDQFPRVALLLDCSAPKFSPCSGGTLHYFLSDHKTEANQALQTTRLARPRI